MVFKRLAIKVNSHMNKTSNGENGYGASVSFSEGMSLPNVGSESSHCF